MTIRSIGLACVLAGAAVLLGGSCYSPSSEAIPCPTADNPLYVCRAGTRCMGNGVCSGIIVPDGGSCPSGLCNVGGQCLPNDSPVACGAACTPCGAVTNGKATCTAGACGFTCDEGYCSSGGACKSTMDDPENCGACGRKCARNAACTNGVCAAVSLANALNYPTDMILGPDGKLYFAEAITPAGADKLAGVIKKLGPTDQNPSVFVTSTTTAPFHITADEKNLYWTEQAFDPTLGQVRKAKLDDGQTAVTLAQAQNAPYSLAVGRDGYLYWTTLNIINRISITGGSFEVVVGGQSRPHGILTTDTNVYWVNSGSGELARAPLGAMQTADKLYTAGASRPESIVHAGGSSPILWTEAVFRGAIQSWNFNSSSQVQILPAQNVPWALAIDGPYVYFTERGSGGDGTVKRVRWDGSEQQPTVLAKGQVQPIAVAVDREFVYWLNAGAVGGKNGELWKVEK